MKLVERGTQDRSGSGGYDSMVTEWWLIDLEDDRLPTGYRLRSNTYGASDWEELFNKVLEYLNLSPYGVTSRVPGAFFSNSPCVRFVGRRALAYVRWGYDV